MPEPTDQYEKLPENLARDLAHLYDARINVPESVDRAVLAEADRRLAAAPRPRLRIAWLAGSLATAAAIVLAVMLSFALLISRGPSHARLAALPGDVDASGRVDILDAFALARHLDQGAALQPGWDLNADGRIDRADVDLIAGQAVSLGKGTHS